MLKYSVKNLRRLSNVGPIELRPITLLVGRNSSGKSTFLRTFPLFRQSINTRTSSPILWYGDLVDFGSFDVSVSSVAKNEPIVFQFTLDDLVVGGSRSFSEPTNTLSKTVYNASISIYIVPVQQRTRISRVVIKIESVSLEIDMTFDTGNRATSLIIDGHDAHKELASHIVLLTTGALFPELRIISRSVDTDLIQRSAFYWTPENNFVEYAIKLLREPLDARIANKTLSDFATSLFDNINLSKSRLRTYDRMVTSTKFKEFIREISGEDSYNLYHKLANYVVLASLPRIFNSISARLRTTFGSALYIGPARARSERYYRYQDLAVSEIDPDGKNFPMFLNSLTRRQRNSLSNWVEQLYGYGVTISQESGHISIKLIEGDSETNIVDVGYGVSQILPVLGQIWWARARTTGSRSRTSNLIAIEQPELHLHPAHQALLADALVGETTQAAMQDDDNRMSFLVETHSETLVNRLGQLISENKISSSDVQILLFEDDSENEMLTKVRSVNFNDDGVLINWPYGFFQPEV